MIGPVASSEVSGLFEDTEGHPTADQAGMVIVAKRIHGANHDGFLN